MLLVEDILKKLGIFKIYLNNYFFLVLLNVRIFTIIGKGRCRNTRFWNLLFRTKFQTSIYSYNN